MRSGDGPTSSTDTAAGEPWHSLSTAETFKLLETDAEGLDAAAAGQRLERYGPNRIEAAKAESWVITLLCQFVSPMIGILLVAFVITLLLQEYADAGAIALILILNASLGFWQERKAARDVQALAQLSAPSSTVIRDGKSITLPAEDLVPGDTVLLESGNKVPADVRLFSATHLQVDESMLTGESDAVTKDTAAVDAAAPIADRTSMAFSGTLVRSGRARAMVVATGTDTELGAISEMVKGPTGKTPLQELTNDLEKKIGIIIVAVSAVLFVSGILLGNELGEMFLTVVALAVASLPESLPIVLTVAMSVGVSRMAKRNALVRHLPAVETLGSTTMIGSDKTGTLTMNELTVQQVRTPAGTTDLNTLNAPGQQLDPNTRLVLRAGALTNEARPLADDPENFSGDAVDAAMAKAALRWEAVTRDEFLAPPLAHAPYEPELGLSQTVRKVDGRRVLFVKGAPDALIAASTHLETVNGPEPSGLDQVRAANETMAAEGLRVLATAYRYLHQAEQLPGGTEAFPAPSGLTFLGLQGMADPPRPGVLEAITQCHDAGIRVLMITGDQPATAISVAEQLGLPAGAEPLTGTEIQTLNDDDLYQRLTTVGVAARVTPADKRRIVEVLQAQDHVVAVTGDGVNDAPALKAAALGVAMGASGTDVAREAADMVLTDDNFVTVVDAVEQGRVTFNAIRKATHFLVANGAASLIAVSISVYADMPLIFLPIQMLFVNVVTNGVQDIALAFEPAEGDELKRKPRSAAEGVLDQKMWIRTGLAGAWMGLAAILMFTWALDSGRTDEYARTLTLTLFIMMNFFFVQTSRFENKSVFSSPFSNPLLLFTAVGALGLHWLAMNWSVSAALMGFVSLSAAEWAICAALGISILVIVELEKLIRYLLAKR
ncbi:HAD-IC family P-type ATPase [Nesterenkonia alkaliphila]|uniref:HAD-IC family P-type ATPase n=2 Tax=Nesterenkonia alkaliphila TaxID=1463631 RepID=A0A7K1UFY3_9MICC|nr:HAD-IC family P-type ATPase [Nesterenkonia alkaliphila]MVT25286.1 HAD-IC family P-type ATPase [Nesterenkonia alkaliphila]